jgi:hypothetical protein
MRVGEILRASPLTRRVALGMIGIPAEVLAESTHTKLVERRAREAVCRAMFRGGQILGWRVLGWRVLGWRVLGWRVLGWRVLGWKVLGWKVLGWTGARRQVGRAQDIGEALGFRAASSTTGWFGSLKRTKLSERGRGARMFFAPLAAKPCEKRPFGAGRCLHAHGWA